MVNALDLTFKEAITLVRFTYGNPTIEVAYTDFTDELTFGGVTYQSKPAIEVKWPVNKGTFEDAPCKIAIPNDDFTAQIAGITAFPECLVTVRELTRDFVGPVSSAALVPFRGRVTRAYKNYQGRNDKILLECLPIKSRLSFPAGLPANHHCIWTLFGRGCGLTQVSHVGTAASIDGKKLTITGLGAQTGKFYHRGFVSKLGLRIGIQNWDAADPTAFYLVRQPPATWVGNTVTVVPGCDKTIETCRARWNNESRFAGIGYAIPAYHPVFEDKG